MAPVLGFSYFQGPMAGQFILDTDFCQTQMALARYKKVKKQLLPAAAKKLNKSQQNYPSTKGKLYAGITWMEKYCYYSHMHHNSSGIRTMQHLNGSK